MASYPQKNANPAEIHDNTALHATTAAALAAAIVYKGVYFNVAGALDIVDLAGNKKTVTGAVGTIYPVQNFGAVTGGGTTLTQSQFLLLR